MNYKTSSPSYNRTSSADLLGGMGLFLGYEAVGGHIVIGHKIYNRFPMEDYICSINQTVASTNLELLGDGQDIVEAASTPHS